MQRLGKSLIIFLFLIGVFAYKASAYAIATSLSKSPEVEVALNATVLRAGVEEYKELPKCFYGTWQVKSILVESSHSSKFKKHGSDIWTLEKIGNIITLSNPVTGATASITVSEVNGNTATFTRGKFNSQDRQTEKVIMTIDGDTFEGTDTITIERQRFSKAYTKDKAVYRIVGNKVSGPSVRELLGN